MDAFHQVLEEDGAWRRITENGALLTDAAVMSQTSNALGEESGTLSGITERRDVLHGR